MSFGSYVPSPDLVSLWWRETKGSAKERAMEVVAMAARYGYQAAVLEEVTRGGDFDR